MLNELTAYKTTLHLINECNGGWKLHNRTPYEPAYRLFRKEYMFYIIMLVCHLSKTSAVSTWKLTSSVSTPQYTGTIF